MRALLPLALLLLAPLVCSLSPHAHKQLSKLRAYTVPAELTLASAGALHTDLLSRSRAIERLHGHVRVVPPRPTPYAPLSALSQVSPPTILPTNYGADPTGKTDSTAAFEAAMADLLRAGSNHSMASGIVDLGGATLDLAGGQYLISRPVVVPMYYGNMLIHRGTLRASPTFPGDQYLIMVGDVSCNPDGQGSCNEFIKVQDVLLDCSHVAAGGFYIAHAMGAVVGPVFVLGFNKGGITIDGGHETMVVDSWLAEYYWSQPAPKVSSSIGVLINGNDHYLDNVIVFAYTNLGVVVNGAANILTGVHTWNGAGTGIVVNSYQTRLIGCYLDYDTLVIVDPEQIAVENTFFLGTNTIFKANHGTVKTLQMHFNTYTGGDSVVLQGSFATVSAVSITDEINGNKLTSAKATLNQTAATQWKFDFSDVLLFPTIEYVTYSIQTSSPLTFSHAARPAVGRVVVVETSVPIDAVVSIEVAQGL